MSIIDAVPSADQLVMAKILEAGCKVTLGTRDARGYFLDALPELAALCATKFSSEELDVIRQGAA